MNPPGRILVFHTAFPGDIIPTLPVIEALRVKFPAARISVVVVPSASGVLQHHPAVNDLIVYDKRGRNRGIRGALALMRRLRDERFDLAVVPHRSVRSAVIVRGAGIPRRIGFSTSALPFLFTDVIPYDRSAHEIRRNLDLVRPLGIVPDPNPLPRVYPGAAEQERVDALLKRLAQVQSSPIVALAPGSKWDTKRWPPEYYARLGSMLTARGLAVVLVGGTEDRELCERIATAIGTAGVLDAAGKLSLLESAEMIRRSSVLVSNDSAPVHLGVAVGTPVLALFGPTVRDFGFTPAGPKDEVIEMAGLACRPCRSKYLKRLNKHGGKACPIGTFVCMKEIAPEMVFGRVVAKIESLPR